MGKQELQPDERKMHRLCANDPLHTKAILMVKCVSFFPLILVEGFVLRWKNAITANLSLCWWYLCNGLMQFKLHPSFRTFLEDFLTT